MTFAEYREKTHEIINEINDLCNSGIAAPDVGAGATRDFFWNILDKIEKAAVYPEHTNAQS